MNCVYCSSECSADVCKTCTEEMWKNGRNLPPEHMVCNLVHNGVEWVPISELNRSKAIRRKCLDCSGGSVVGVKMCKVPNCPLFPWRLGVGPPTGRKVSQKALDALKKWRESHDANSGA